MSNATASSARYELRWAIEAFGEKLALMTKVIARSGVPRASSTKLTALEKIEWI
jgi:hypothetical protein